MNTRQKIVNTVLGPIPMEKLGVTLMHEHIIWDSNGADKDTKDMYTVEEVVETILPHLLKLKEAGCDTLVEATPAGAGRDVVVLKLCSERSGINIITNSGAWDAATPGELVPEEIKAKDVDEIVEIWVNEFNEGIDDTGIKPGFIKMTLPDRVEISQAHEKLLRAAIRTSNKTGLPVQCHIASPIKLARGMEIVEEEGLPLDKFIWVHADFAGDLDKVVEMARKGIWVELDALARVKNYEWYIPALKRLLEEDLIDRVLISQDAGTYYVGEKEYDIFPYDKVFREFIPLCREAGIPKEVFDQIFITNPAKFLGIEE